MVCYLGEVGHNGAMEAGLDVEHLREHAVEFSLVYRRSAAVRTQQQIRLIALTEVGVVGEVERRARRQLGGRHPSSLTYITDVNTLQLHAQQLDIYKQCLTYIDCKTLGPQQVHFLIQEAVDGGRRYSRSCETNMPSIHHRLRSIIRTQ